MMVSPMGYLEGVKKLSYAELIKEKNQLIREINRYEKGKIKQEEYIIDPALEVVYQMNLEYLAELCKYMSERYNEECVVGESGGKMNEGKA